MTLLFVASFTISCSKQNASSFQREVDEPQILIEIESPPLYLNGSDDGLMSDIYAAILNTAPVTQDSVSGRAIIHFDITEQGLIDPNSIEVLRNRSVPDDYLNAAIEAIKGLGKFMPGKVLGEPLKSGYTVPILYPVPLDRVKTRE